MIVGIKPEQVIKTGRSVIAAHTNSRTGKAGLMMWSGGPVLRKEELRPKNVKLNLVFASPELRDLYMDGLVKETKSKDEYDQAVNKSSMNKARQQRRDAKKGDIFVCRRAIPEPGVQFFRVDGFVNQREAIIVELGCAVQETGMAVTSFLPVHSEEMYVPNPVKIIDGFFRVDNQHFANKWDGEPVKVRSKNDV